MALAALSAMSNYAAASAFTIMIVLAVPAWDAPLPSAGHRCCQSLNRGQHRCGQRRHADRGMLFALFEVTNQLDSGPTDQLSAIEGYLQQHSTGHVDGKTAEKIQQLATVGVSRLRALALSANARDNEVARQSTTVSLVGPHC